MTKDLFIETILALQGQCDKDAENARRLSTIYGSDINPNDNRLLTNIIFKFLQKHFPPVDGLCDIEIFCFEQDFGRKLEVENPIEKLWISLLKNMEVVGAEELTFKEKDQAIQDEIEKKLCFGQESAYSIAFNLVNDITQRIKTCKYDKEVVFIVAIHIVESILIYHPIPIDPNSNQIEFSETWLGVKKELMIMKQNFIINPNSCK